MATLFLDQYNASAFALSGGLMYTHPDKVLAAGVTIQHLGGYTTTT